MWRQQQLVASPQILWHPQSFMMISPSRIILQPVEFIQKSNHVNAGSWCCYCRELIASHYFSLHLQWNGHPLARPLGDPDPACLSQSLSCWVLTWTSHLSLEHARPVLSAVPLCSLWVTFSLPEFASFLLFKIQLRFFLRQPFLATLPKKEFSPTLHKPLAPSLPTLALPCHFLSHSLVYALSHGTHQYLKLRFHVSGFNFLPC